MLNGKAPQLDFILAEHYPLTVSNDHVIRSKDAGLKAKILPSAHRISYAKAKIDLYKHTNGEFTLLYKEERLRFKALE